MTFTRSTSKIGRYIVTEGDDLVGFVEREEKWTVRGTRIQWRATRFGKYLGTEASRKNAAGLLQAAALKAAA